MQQIKASRPLTSIRNLAAPYGGGQTSGAAHGSKQAFLPAELVLPIAAS